MPSLPLPLGRKLAALARHVRRRRLWRGLSLMVLVLAVGFGGLFAADFLFDFSAEVLAAYLAGWVGTLAFVAAFGLIVPLLRPVNFRALAARIEQKYPDLAERLTSAVGFCDGPEMHGAPTFITQLLADAEERTRKLVFRQAVPGRWHGRLGIAAAVTLGLAVVPALMVPDRYAEFSRRLLSSWFAPPALWFEVSPGDAYAARGRPLTWTVVLHRRDERVAWPASANLVWTDAVGRRKQILMQLQIASNSEVSRTWTCGLDQILDDLEYYVEASGTRSPAFRVQAVEPIAMPDSPSATITPPPYVNPQVVAQQRFDGLGSLSAVEFSQIELSFAFNRPATSANLEIVVNPSADSSGKHWSVPVHVEGERGKLMLPVLPVGSYQLTLRLEAEQQITSDVILPDLTIRPDQAPLFTHVPALFGSAASATDTQPTAIGSGHGNAATIAPTDTIRFTAGVADAEGLDRVEVEYRVNDGPVRTHVAARLNGALTANIESFLKLDATAKPGDTIQFRLKAVDNRCLKAGIFTAIDGRPTPLHDLGTQVTYYPPNGGVTKWLTIRVDEKASGLKEQEIAAQRDAVKKQIDAIKQKIEQERKELGQLDQFGKNHPYWSVEQGQQLAKLRKDNHAIKKDLIDLALEAQQTPELQAIGEETQQVAQQEMTESGEAFNRAQQSKDSASKRDKQLAKADRELRQALQKLDALGKANEELTKNRLDEMKIQELAQKEEELAQKVADLHAKQPTSDPKLESELKKLQQQQQQIAQELQKLVEQNPAAQARLKKMQADEARQLAQKAEQLAKAQEELAREIEKDMAAHQKNLLEDFARKQQVIADRAAKLGQQSLPSAHGRQLPPLDPKAALLAVAAIEKGALAQALDEQSKSAKELERLAEGLDTALMVEGDLRDVVQKLVKRQREVEDRLLTEAKQVGQKTPAQLAAALKAINAQQGAIRDAAKKLQATQPAFAGVEKRSAQALLALQRADAFQAWEEMKLSRQALEQLAALPPSGKPAVNDKPPAPPKPDDPAVAQARQLQSLAKEQWELRSQLQKLLVEPELPPASRDKLAQQQQQLNKQGEELKQKLEQMAKGQADSPKSKDPAAKSAKSGQEAGIAMQQAKDKAEQGKAKAAKEAAEQAAKKLSNAAKQAQETADKLGGQPKPGGGKKSSQQEEQMGRALEEGQQQAAKAAQNLSQKKLQDASTAMKQAAQSLKQAGKQMGQQSKGKSLANPAQTGYLPDPGGRLPDLSKYGPEGKKFAGKPWGELPGQLRSKVIADLRAQYGETYATIISRYFEEQSAAATKRK